MRRRSTAGLWNLPLLLLAVLTTTPIVSSRVSRGDELGKSKEPRKQDEAEPPIRVMIIDGQNNHDWKSTTPILRAALESTKRFQVAVVTAPTRGGFEGFAPKFKDFQAVVSNYNGADWPESIQTEFVDFVKSGGGFVSVHAANNAFPKWVEYNEIIGLGGWGGRNEKSGPYVRFKEGKQTQDKTPGNGGSHGAKHEFVVEHRVDDHPITKGLPTKWMHTKDELYDRLRGPAKNLTVLATAFADKSTGGSGEHEPMLMVIEYGKGRVFHTTLGHDVTSMKCVGFQTTLNRGVEWAATGVVKQEPPKEFPAEDKSLAVPDPAPAAEAAAPSR